jgi:hypothetical protein
MCKMAIYHLHAQHWFQHTFVKYLLNFEDFMFKIDIFLIQILLIYINEKKIYEILFLWRASISTNDIISVESAKLVH